MSQGKSLWAGITALLVFAGSPGNAFAEMVHVVVAPTLFEDSYNADPLNPDPLNLEGATITLVYSYDDAARPDGSYSYHGDHVGMYWTDSVSIRMQISNRPNGGADINQLLGGAVLKQSADYLSGATGPIFESDGILIDGVYVDFEHLLVDLLGNRHYGSPWDRIDTLPTLSEWQSISGEPLNGDVIWETGITQGYSHSSPPLLEFRIDGGKWQTYVGLGEGSGELMVYDAASLPPQYVPIPAAAWLMFSALGSLGLMRRRSRQLS